MLTPARIHTLPSLMQNYYGNGKLLLSGEYYVLDGALALAVPTNLGQKLKVSYFPSEHKVLHWKSYDNDGQLWFETRFDVETFECLDRYVSQKSILLQKILRMARKMASGFLKGREYVLVETYLEFPRLWGLGSSSTLIHNVANWAGVNPFDLLFGTLGGSGYDVACAQADGAILYEKHGATPQLREVEFNPPFKEHLYFVYLGKKQSSAEGIEYYRSLIGEQKSSLVEKLTKITQGFLQATTLSQFDALIRNHEEVIASSLNMQRVKDLYFADYWGEVKSLGAWGGDFVLVTSEKSRQETRNYFFHKGFEVFIPYHEMVKNAAKHGA
jgi:mevalonate kinase